MSARLSRREMKRDEVREGFDRLLLFVQDHGRTLLWTAAALAAGGIVAALVYGQLQERRVRAQEALAEALELLEPDADSGIVAADAREQSASLLEAVRERHGGSPAARVAAAFLAKRAAEAGDIERARELWEEVLDGGDDALSAEVFVNLVALDRAEGRGEEAVERLRSALGGGRHPVPEPELLAQLATTLDELGRTVEGQEVWQRLVDEHPDSPQAFAARQKLDQAS